MTLSAEYKIHWVIPFKALEDSQQYRIEIYDKGYTGGAVNLRGADVPFTIDEDDEEDFFLPIRTQTGMITFVDNGNIVPQMLSDTPLNRPVILRKGREQVWAGFLSCESMSQPYADYVHTVSVGVQCPLATLQGIEIDQDNIGFVSLNILLQEALRHVFTVVAVQPYEDWGAGAWGMYVIRDYWLTRIDYDSTKQKPFTGETYYDVLTDIFQYFGMQMTMHNGEAYITQNDFRDYNDTVTPEWFGTGHEQDFLSGVRKITQECVPDESDTDIMEIPDDEFHLYDETLEGHPFEWWCPPGLTSETWYAYSTASGTIPPIINQRSAQDPTIPVMSGGLFEEFRNVKGMMFAVNSGHAFHFESTSAILSVSKQDVLRISMSGALIRHPYYVLEKQNTTGLVVSIRFYVRYGNLWLKRVNTSVDTKGYQWVNDSNAYFDAYIDANCKLCTDADGTTHLSIDDDIAVQLPHGCDKLTIDVYAPTLAPGYFQYYFTDDFSVCLDVPEARKRHRHIFRHEYDSAFADVLETELSLGCKLCQVPYSHGFVFHKPRSEYEIVGEYYERLLFERMKHYYSYRHHILTIVAKMDDYKPDSGVVVDGVTYAVLARSYNYRDSTVTLKLINIQKYIE